MSFILKENNIEIAAPVYSHDNSRYHVRNHFFFATKHSTWLLFVNTQLGLHHITCFKLIHRNPQNGQFGCSSCAAMLSFPSVVPELQLQFCWSAVSKWSYDVRAFGLPIVLFEYHLFSVLSGNWTYYLKKLQVYEKGMVILNLLRVGWKQIKVHSFNSIKKGNVFSTEINLTQAILFVFPFHFCTYSLMTSLKLLMPNKNFPHRRCKFISSAASGQRLLAYVAIFHVLLCWNKKQHGANWTCHFERIVQVKNCLCLHLQTRDQRRSQKKLTN